MLIYQRDPEGTSYNPRFFTFTNLLTNQLLYPKNHEI